MTGLRRKEFVAITILAALLGSAIPVICAALFDVPHPLTYGASALLSARAALIVRRVYLREPRRNMSHDN